jgi:hypothetical protein
MRLGAPSFQRDLDMGKAPTKSNGGVLVPKVS